MFTHIKKFVQSPPKRDLGHATIQQTAVLFLPSANGMPLSILETSLPGQRSQDTLAFSLKPKTGVQ